MLSERQSDGKSLREHLEAVERMTKKKPAELENLVEMPVVFIECWHWFLELNQTRTSGFGIAGITYTEMHNFFSLSGIDPEVWEVRAIKMFDNIALNSAKAKEDKESAKNKKK